MEVIALDVSCLLLLVVILTSSLIIIFPNPNSAIMPEETTSAYKKGAYREADQHEKAYQLQKGVFVFGKPGQRKETSKRSKHVSLSVGSNSYSFLSCETARIMKYVNGD